MKKIIAAVITLLMTTVTHAQLIDRLSVELNLGRVARENGIFQNDYYQHKASFITGFTIAHHSSEKWQQYVGVRKLDANHVHGTGFTVEDNRINGFEFRLGTKFSPKSDKRFFLTSTLNAYGQYQRSCLKC